MITARNLHAKLAILGARFLYDHGCELVTCEFSTSMNALPGNHVFDAVGLDLRQREVRIVEAKTSRGDFLGDDCIHGSSRGAGGAYADVAQHCWLICPDGVILAEEVPPSWGLLYFCPDVAELTYLNGLRRLRRRVRADDAATERVALGDRYLRTRKPGEGCLVVRRAVHTAPLSPLSSQWDATVRGVSRKLTRSALGISYRHGKPCPQPVECLEL